MFWYLSRRTAIGGLSLLIIAALLTPASLFAAQRVVYVEDFTSTTCGPCYSLAPTFEAAMEELGVEVVTVTAYHMNWPAPGDDPWFADNPTDNGGSGVNGGRRAYYGVNGVPALYLDGAVLNERTQAGIVNAVRNRARTASPAVIEMRARIVGENLAVHVEVTAESAINTRLYINLNEQQAHYQTPRWPDWDEHFHPMVKMIPDYNGTAVALGAGESRSFDFEVSMNGLGWHELDPDNLELVAFLQNANRQVLQSYMIDLGIDYPSLTTIEWRINDSAMGDGDGRAEPGELAALELTIENGQRYLPAETIRIDVTTDDPDIEFVNNFWELQGLQNGDRANNADSPITFNVPEDFVAHPVTFTISTVAQPGDFTNEETIEFMVDWPPFLLVDASNNGNAGAAMVNLFGTDPLPWCDRWDRNELGVVPEELTPNYLAIIWHAFNNQDPINEFEAEVLAAYLEQGGCLVIGGSFVPNTIGQTALFRDYLNIQLANADGGANYVAGVVGDAQFHGSNLFLGGGNGAGLPNQKPVFAAREGSREVLIYNDGGQNLGSAGIAHETATYSTLALAFPIESIGGAVRTEARSAFVNRIWNWVQAHTQDVTTDPAAPYQFSMDAAYPNPFNSSTTLRFSLPVASNATLKIYDVAGKEVADLVQGFIPAGRRAIAFNASDYGLGAGLYFARLESDAGTLTRSLLYLK